MQEQQVQGPDWRHQARAKPKSRKSNDSCDRRQTLR